MPKHTRTSASLTALAATAAALSILLTAHAQTPASASVVGDVERGEQQFEAICAECHGAAATAPTLRGIIGREIASVTSYLGYSDALKAKQPMKWTKENLNTYLKSPRAFAPGSMMDRDFPDAQMRADVIAYLESLPPPR